MNRLLMVWLMFMVGACSSSYELTENDTQIKNVYLNFDGARIVSETDVFSDSLAREIEQNGLADSLGTGMLQSVLTYYGTQTKGFSFTKEREEADILIEVNEILVSKSFFTANIPHPGPIYRIKLHTSIRENDSPQKSLVHKSRANMSAINFSNHTVYWMDSKEKQNEIYQQATFVKGLKNCYQKLYFNLFGISL